MNNDEIKANDKINEDIRLKRIKAIRITLNVIAILLFLALSIYVTIKAFPIFYSLKNDKDKFNEAITKIQSYGKWSFLIIIGLQIFQVLFMIIPSGPIVLASGIMFNPFIATLVCLIGQTLGVTIIYILVKIFGYNLVRIFVDEEKIKENRLIKNKERTMILLIGYLFIPMLPKDIVAFICPFTKIKLLPFILINFFVRIPMTISTVLISNSLISGNYILAVIFALLSLILAIICFIFNKQIVAKLEQRKKVDTLE